MQELRRPHDVQCGRRGLGGGAEAQEEARDEDERDAADGWPGSNHYSCGTAAANGHTGYRFVRQIRTCSVPAARWEDVSGQTDGWACSELTMSSFNG